MSHRFPFIKLAHTHHRGHWRATGFFFPHIFSHHPLASQALTRTHTLEPASPPPPASSLRARDFPLLKMKGKKGGGGGGGGNLLKMEKKKKKSTMAAESDLLPSPKSHLFVCSGAAESVTEETFEVHQNKVDVSDSSN